MPQGVGEGCALAVLLAPVFLVQLPLNSDRERCTTFVTLLAQLQPNSSGVSILSPPAPTMCVIGLVVIIFPVPLFTWVFPGTIPLGSQQQYGAALLPPRKTEALAVVQSPQLGSSIIAVHPGAQRAHLHPTSIKDCNVVPQADVPSMQLYVSLLTQR